MLRNYFKENLLISFPGAKMRLEQPVVPWVLFLSLPSVVRWSYHQTFSNHWGPLLIISTFQRRQLEHGLAMTLTSFVTTIGWIPHGPWNLNMTDLLKQKVTRSFPTVSGTFYSPKLSPGESDPEGMRANLASKIKPKIAMAYLARESSKSKRLLLIIID